MVEKEPKKLPNIIQTELQVKEHHFLIWILHLSNFHLDQMEEIETVCVKWTRQYENQTGIDQNCILISPIVS